RARECDTPCPLLGYAPLGHVALPNVSSFRPFLVDTVVWQRNAIGWQREWWPAEKRAFYVLVQARLDVGPKTWVCDPLGIHRDPKIGPLERVAGAHTEHLDQSRVRGRPKH